MDIKIAIVEDEEAAAKKLLSMIKKYSESDKRFNFETEVFSDALDFLAAFDGKYDAVFFDIQLPGVTGIEAAKRLRKIDDKVMVVFVTNMANYALESYEVHAFDFILKPLIYDSFFIKFRRICNTLEHEMSDVYITLTGRFMTKRIAVSDILYVEVMNHDIIFHLKDGEYRTGGTMSGIEEKLKGYHFSRSSASFLVNLRYVKETYGETVVVVGGDTLKISRSRKNEFMSDFAKYAGGSV